MKLWSAWDWLDVEVEEVEEESELEAALVCVEPLTPICWSASRMVSSSPPPAVDADDAEETVEVPEVLEAALVLDVDWVLSIWASKLLNWEVLARVMA